MIEFCQPRTSSSFSFVPLLYIIAILISFVTNLFFGIAIFFTPILRKQYNIFIGFFNFSNALISIFFIFEVIANQRQDWIFGNGSCKFIGFSLEFLMMFSLLIIFVLTIDRYCSIYHNEKYIDYLIMPYTYVFGVIAFVFFMNIPVIVGLVVQPGICHFNACQLDVSENEMLKLFFHIDFAAFFVAPMLFIILTYLVCLRYYFTDENSSMNNKSETQDNRSPYFGTFDRVNFQTFSMRKNSELYYFFLGVMVFVLTFTPYRFISKLQLIDIDIHPAYYSISQLVYIIFMGVYPFIFMSKTPNFLKFIKKVKGDISSNYES